MSSAIFSPCQAYRYVLTRQIPKPGDASLTIAPARPLLFVMLNPSTADAAVNDNTIRKCMWFAEREGTDVMTVVNLFALRSTDPKVLYGHPDPVGPENDRHLEEQIRLHDPDRIVVAWGTHEIAQLRGRKIHDLFASRGLFRCLGMNQNGSPRHPLFLPKVTPLVVWSQR